MKTIFYIWLISLVLMIGSAESLNTFFWLSFVAFIFSSRHIIKHSKSI